MEKQKIVIPDLGGVDTVTVLEILVAPGERVEVDQAIMTLESEKASMDVPSDRAGVVQEILVKIGQQVGEGDACILVDADIDNNKVENQIQSTRVQNKQSSYHKANRPKAANKCRLYK